MFCFVDDYFNISNASRSGYVITGVFFTYFQRT